MNALLGICFAITCQSVGIDVCHETIRFWWNRFGPIFAKEIRKRKPAAHSLWRWHIDEVFVKINGQRCYLWRAVDHEGAVLECVVTKKRDRRSALKILNKLMKRYGKSKEIVTDKLDSYSSALCEIGYNGYHETGQYQNNQCENSHLHFRRRERAMCRFRSMRSLQKFTSIQCQFHNHLQHQRHFETRQDFKKIRDQSLSDWQNICAA